MIDTTVWSLALRRSAHRPNRYANRDITWLRDESLDVGALD